METREDYFRIKDIFSQIPEVDIHRRPGSKLRFPMYLTEKLANTPIEALELSVRANNSLRRMRIDTIGDFCEKFHGSSDLKQIRGCGANTITEIMDSLFEYQYSVLNKEEKAKFLLKVIEMNICVDKVG